MENRGIEPRTFHSCSEQCETNVIPLNQFLMGRLVVTGAVSSMPRTPVCQLCCCDSKLAKIFVTFRRLLHVALALMLYAWQAK